MTSTIGQRCAKILILSEYGGWYIFHTAQELFNRSKINNNRSSLNISLQTDDYIFKPDRFTCTLVIEFQYTNKLLYEQKVLEAMYKIFL